ncbi:MAG: site-specific integrase [Sphingobacteriales bacterium]|nr:site-specific integrase [Sphingobacteriales bacterium]
MITLPNGCTCSKLSVYPKNWQAKNAKIATDWYIIYRFYDPRYPKPKQVMVKGMNQFKKLSERQEATKKALADELDKLVKGELNPFNRASNSKTGSVDLERESPIIDALKLANQKVTVSTSTQRDLKYLLIHLEKAVKVLGLQSYHISNVTRKTVKLLLEEISSTPDRFNKNRSYLMMLFSELCEAEAIDANPVRDIKKKKVLKHLRTVLTNEERITVNQYLEENYPSFHRFLHIFFHSGARITELLRVTGADMDMKNQRYKVVIRKGRNYTEVWKTIKDVAMPYWVSVMEECVKGDFVFSVGLKPGPIQIQPYQITKRWYRLVKNKIGITADFYSLKHLHTTEIVDLLDENEAAKHNEHTSTAMVVGIYDVGRDSRQHNKVKGLNNKFA